MKTRCVFIAFLFVLTFECSLSNDLDDIDSIVQERPCTDAGGRCVFAKDCPEDVNIMTRGQCPNQAYRNVDCCFGISKKETRCENRGGICIDKNVFCGTAVKNIKTNCAEYEQCCILV